MHAFNAKGILPGCVRNKCQILSSALLGCLILMFFYFQLDFRNTKGLILFNNSVISGTKNNHTNPAKVYSNDLTVVTAYFNLGRFQKGGPSSIFTNSMYRQWMTIFASIDNPLIAFIDNDNDFKFFTSIRSVLPENITRLIRVNRSQLWSFGIENRISEIYKTPGYPKHHPNTVLSAYSSAMHAKYEVMQMAIRENPFRTKYFCWLDIGLFRSLTIPNSFKGLTYIKPKNPSKFHLGLPISFSSDSIAYTQVYQRDITKSPKDIVYGNHVWLCGCYFVGEHTVLYRWTQEYQNATMTMLANKLMSTDQQVIYSMFNTMNPKTKIQTYTGDGRYDEWFHLAYISRKNS